MEDSGRVRAYFPLKEELSATQWIGGVIIISPMYGLEICSGEKFADFLHRAMLETGCEQPVYAWHIADLICRERSLQREADWYVYNIYLG